MITRPSGSIYDSARLAAGYASSRPPVHPLIIRLIAQRLARKARRALDVGCGAGLSTAALEPIADVSIGLDPSAAMLTHHRDVAPRARFVLGRAEALPFAADTFDLITAAGSLNYANLDRFLPDAARVLTRDGTLAIYDFSAARRFRDGPELDDWFTEFQRRYPFPPGYALDVTTLDYRRFALQFCSYQPFEVSLPLTLDGYVRYAMSETNVEQAIAEGTPEADVRTWCRRTLGAFFGSGPREILFDGYVGYVSKGNRGADGPTDPLFS